MRVAGHDAEVERNGERNAAADAKAFDRGDRHLVHLVPGARQARPEPQVPAQRAQIHGRARTALLALQVGAGAEGLRAGQDHDRGVGVVVEALRGGRQLAHCIG